MSTYQRIKKKFLGIFLSILMVIPMGITAPINTYAADSGIRFTRIQIVDITDPNNASVVANLMDGTMPKLSATRDYSLNVSYTIPQSLQMSDTYLKRHY